MLPRCLGKKKERPNKALPSHGASGKKKKKLVAQVSTFERGGGAGTFRIEKLIKGR